MVFSFIPVTSLALMPRCSPRIMTLVPGGPSAGEMPVTTGGGLIVIYLFLLRTQEIASVGSFSTPLSYHISCLVTCKLLPRSPPSKTLWPASKFLAGLRDIRDRYDAGSDVCTVICFGVFPGWERRGGTPL